MDSFHKSTLDYINKKNPKLVRNRPMVELSLDKDKVASVYGYSNQDYSSSGVTRKITSELHRRGFQFFPSMMSRKSKNDSRLFPPNIVYYDPVTRITAYCLGPRRRFIFYKSRLRSNTADNYGADGYNIAFPYTYILFKPPTNPRIYNSHEFVMLFSSKIITDEKDTSLHAPPLPNCYVDGGVCTAQISLSTDNLFEAHQEVMSALFSGTFNLDYIDMLRSVFRNYAVKDNNIEVDFISNNSAFFTNEKFIKTLEGDLSSTRVRDADFKQGVKLFLESWEQIDLNRILDINWDVGTYSRHSFHSVLKRMIYTNSLLLHHLLDSLDEYKEEASLTQVPIMQKIRSDFSTRS